ncbi:hypothetical protein [Pseudomonas sp. PI1]|uniref:hypothetical protein n=1 Tax=Pseudomonas sp. PI1 TaxID=1582493 RepID=UPI001269D7EA|nr:hypothetical protein [Pseudomonas sp. PI1]
MNALAIMPAAWNGYLFYVPQWIPLKERLIDDRRAAGIFPQRPAATGIAPGARLVPRLREIEDEGRFIKRRGTPGCRRERHERRKSGSTTIQPEMVDVDSQALLLWQQEAVRMP